MMLAYTNTVNFYFILQPTIVASILTDEECRTLIKEQEATSEVPEEFKDLFPDDDGSQLVDEYGNVIETPPLPPPVILTTDELLTYKREQGYVYQFAGATFLRNSKILDPIIDNVGKYSAILFHSYQDYRACYRKTTVSLNEHNDIIISTVDHDLDKVTLNNFLRSNEAQLLAAFTDEYYKAYALKDGYYLVVHYDREKPSTSLFNDYEAFKDYVAILPPLV